MEFISKTDIKPMSKTIAWMLFLGFGVLFFISFYFFTPILEKVMPSFYAYMLALDICFIFMLIFTFIAIKKEKDSKSLWQRMNYHKI